MSEENVFYVYVHRRGDNNEVFYVGKGKDRRAWSTKKRNEWWKNIFNKHGRVVEIVEKDMSEDDAFDLEIELIKFYKENGHILCNIRPGGEGTSYKPTQSQLDRMREANKQPEHRRFMKLVNSKPVLCSNGMTFESCKDAEIWLGNKPSSSKVSTCARREAHSTNGFVWRYLDDCEDLQKCLDQRLDAFVEFGCKEKLDKYKPKTVYSDCGITFKSCSDVVRWFHSLGKTKVSTSHISKVCLKKGRPTIYGIKFSYDNEFQKHDLKDEFQKISEVGPEFFNTFYEYCVQIDELLNL